MDMLTLFGIGLISLIIAYLVASVVWKGIEFMFKAAFIIILTILISGALFFMLALH